MKFDVVIAGAGPAGAAVALELAAGEGLSVAIVDPRDRRRVRAGETLPPGSDALFARLGLRDAFLAAGHARCQGTIAAWGGDDVHYTDFAFHPAGHGWRIDRDAFESMLVDEARRRGVAFFDGAVEQAVRDRGTWHIPIGRTQLEAHLLVDATGRGAMLARRLGARKITDDLLVGIAGVFALDSLEGIEVQWAMIDARRDGWGYSAVMPGGELAVVAMTDTDLAHAAHLHEEPHWLAWLHELRHLRRRLAHARLLSAPVVASAGSHRLDRAAGDGWLAAGDAACGFDPLSSQGIIKALRCGIGAASAIRRALDGDADALAAYDRKIAGEYAAYRDVRARYYAMERRWPTAPFWTRRRQQLSARQSEARS